MRRVCIPGSVLLSWQADWKASTRTSISSTLSRFRESRPYHGGVRHHRWQPASHLALPQSPSWRPPAVVCCRLFRSSSQQTDPSGSVNQTSSEKNDTPPNTSHVAKPTIPAGTMETLESVDPDHVARIRERLRPVVVMMDRSKASLQASANGYYDHITTAVLPTLAELINTLTGYSHVQECKNRVLQKDADLNAARERSDASKRLYEQTIEERRKCQRELNSLLQRKDSWLDSDITRFTELYRKDLNLEQSENQARNEHQAATEAFDRCHREYLNEIRERYIEEQLYSDKIRRASTWWTWGLISLHFALFVVIQLFVEPRKRRILKEELSALITNTSATDVRDVEGAIGAQLAPITQRLAAIESAVAKPTSSHFSTPLLPYAEPEPQTVGTSSKVESASTIHRKDMLFVKGFLMGTAVGIGSMVLYLYSG